MIDNNKKEKLLDEIFNRLNERGIRNEYSVENQKNFNFEMTEIIQEIVLKGLSETDFFENNVFHGGSAFRIVYGLKRYSRDLDFNMIEKQEINWNNYIKEINNYWGEYGLEFIRIDKYENRKKNKAEIKEKMLLEYMKEKRIFNKVLTKNQTKKLSVEMESYFRATAFKNGRVMLKTFGGFEVNVLSINCMFSGKINAILTRNIKGCVFRPHLNTNYGTLEQDYGTLEHKNGTFEQDYGTFEQKYGNI